MIGRDDRRPTTMPATIASTSAGNSPEARRGRRRGARPTPAQAGNDERDRRGGIGGARKCNDQRISGAGAIATIAISTGSARPQQANQHKRQRHRDIGADIAAADMHAGKGRDDPVIGSEIEEAGEQRALDDRRRRNQRQTRRHAAPQPGQRVAARAQPLAQKRQQRQCRHQPFGHAQGVVRAQIGIVRPARRPGHREPQRHAGKTAEDGQRQRRRGQARKRENRRLAAARAAPGFRS